MALASVLLRQGTSFKRNLSVRRGIGPVLSPHHWKVQVGPPMCILVIFGNQGVQASAQQSIIRATACLG